MPVCVMIHTCIEKGEEKYASNITCFTKPPQPATAALGCKTVIGFKYMCVCNIPQTLDTNTVENLSCQH